MPKQLSINAFYGKTFIIGIMGMEMAMIESFMWREQEWSWEIRKRLPDAHCTYELLNQLWDYPELDLLLTVTTRPSVHFLLKGATAMYQPVPFICIEDQQVWRSGTFVFAEEVPSGLVCLRIAPAAAEQSFLNWAWHHVRQPIGKVSSVPNFGFWLYKPCLSVLSKAQFGLQPESASLGLQSFCSDKCF